MKLEELIDELRGNLLRDSSTLKSGPDDAYWSDDTLVRYINDAQRRFARRSLCIADDTTPEVVEIELESGISIYDLHPSILRVVSARHQDAQSDLTNMTHDAEFAGANSFTEFANFSAALNETGQPMRFTTDEGVQIDDEHQIRIMFKPIPDANQQGKTVSMRVRRLPINRLSMEDTDACPEIPEDWHLDMLEWAAWRALRNWDLDAEDRKKADSHKTRFDEAVKECLHEIEQRKMFQPPKWSFGQNGFAGYQR